MEKEQIQRIDYFIHTVVLGELSILQKGGSKYFAFVAMGQVIEVLGSLLDNKPMKAKGQSARRFNACINYLMGGRYRLVNQNGMLYDKLRNQMVHTFLPSKDVQLIGFGEGMVPNRHLSMENGQLVMEADTLLTDLQQAMERLMTLLKSGKVKAKNISLDEE